MWPESQCWHKKKESEGFGVDLDTPAAAAGGYGEKRKKCCVFLSIQQLTNNLLEEEHMFRKNL